MIYFGFGSVSYILTPIYIGIYWYIDCGIYLTNMYITARQFIPLSFSIANVIQFLNFNAVPS